MYLLDTNVCIDFLTAQSATLAARMNAAFGRLSISAVTFAELAVGSHRSDNPVEDARRVDAFAAGLDVLPFDQAAARTYGTAARALGVGHDLNDPPDRTRFVKTFGCTACLNTNWPS